jgi:hypothetical protein
MGPAMHEAVKANLIATGHARSVGVVMPIIWAGVKFILSA